MRVKEKNTSVLGIKSINQGRTITLLESRIGVGGGGYFKRAAEWSVSQEN
jgi:hypothetical protein